MSREGYSGDSRWNELFVLCVGRSTYSYFSLGISPFFFSTLSSQRVIYNMALRLFVAAHISRFLLLPFCGDRQSISVNKDWVS